MGIPDIAIIVPTRNRREVLPRAIDSVFSQSYENFELIVVDDCSDDDTVSYLQSIADPRLKWHRFDEWRRGNAARNHAVKMSRAPLLTFLDSDDQYLPGRLAGAVAFFKQNPAVDVRISSFTSVTGPNSVPRINPDALFAREEFERYLTGYCLYLGGSGITMRRKAFDEIGGFDATLGRMQDRELLLRVARSRGCASVGRIEWVKNRSHDSLSYQRDGKVTALGDLCRRHPVIREKYPELLRYLVAREIIASVLQGWARQAVKAYGEAKRDPGIDVSLLGLLPGYFRGRRRRLEIRAEILSRYGVRMD